MLRAEAEAAASAVESALARCPDFDHPVRRVDALFLLFQAVFHAEALRRRLLEALIQACRDANSWKSGDRLREAAKMLGAGRAEEANRVLSAMRDDKYKRQATALIASGLSYRPRDFL